MCDFNVGDRHAARGWLRRVDDRPARFRSCRNVPAVQAALGIGREQCNQTRERNEGMNRHSFIGVSTVERD